MNGPQWMIFKGRAQVVCSTRTIADWFGMKHTAVLRIVRRAEATACGGIGNCIERSTYRDRLGRNQPLYYLNRRGLDFFISSVYARGGKAERYVTAYGTLTMAMSAAVELGWV